MSQKFKNDARCNLASALGIADTDILLPAGFGDRFPVANMGVGLTGDWFKVTLEDVTATKEIVKVRTRSGGSDILSDVLRGQEGTTAQAWTAGSGATATVVALRLTADDVERGLGQDWAYIPEHEISAVSSVKTLTVDSRGGHIRTDGNHISIPAATFSEGDVVVIYNNDSSSRQIRAGAGVTLVGSSATTGTHSLESEGLCTLFCVNPSKFKIVGDGVYYGT
jgi:hypothetical protein